MLINILLCIYKNSVTDVNCVDSIRQTKSVANVVQILVIFVLKLFSINLIWDSMGKYDKTSKKQKTK